MNILSIITEHPCSRQKLYFNNFYMFLFMGLATVFSPPFGFALFYMQNLVNNASCLCACFTFICSLLFAVGVAAFYCCGEALPLFPESYALHLAGTPRFPQLSAAWHTFPHIVFPAILFTFAVCFSIALPQFVSK